MKHHSDNESRPDRLEEEAGTLCPVENRMIGCFFPKNSASDHILF